VSELVEKLFAIHDALRAESIPHAFGGAIALAYCVEEPRGTRDLDLNIFVDAQGAERVLGKLPDGVRVSEEDIRAVERDGQTRLFWDGVPVDVFLNNLPLHRAVAEAVVWVPLEGKQFPALDCASLVIFKSLSDRTKDWADIEAVAVATPEDIETAARTLSDLLGEEDPASRRLRAISSDNPSCT
jgi:hypothetical protein